MIIKSEATFEVMLVTDTAIILRDLDQGKSVTNDADGVIDALGKNLSDGIGLKRVFYRDTMDMFCELRTETGRFSQFAPCTPSQQQFLMNLMEQQS